ncbi:MAG: fructosamine kinase family protein [Rhodospirillales bacterium]
MSPFVQRLTDLFGSPVTAQSALSGGCVGDVRRVTLADGRRLVVKSGPAGGKLDLEGWMLEYLARQSALPVPKVHHGEPGLLVMDWIEAAGRLDSAAQAHAGHLVAGLHGVTATTFGLERDTLIGGLHQPNPATRHWVDFFRDHRLLHMAEEAERAGELPTDQRIRIDKLAAKLGEIIGEPSAPALLHGDLWGGNVLADQGQIAAFIDPACFYGHPEIELAFTQLFGTFGPAFFDAYREDRAIEPGFFEERLALYNLYPLLVHVRLFGGSYLGSVKSTLDRFGV